QELHGLMEGDGLVGSGPGPGPQVISGVAGSPGQIPPAQGSAVATRCDPSAARDKTAKTAKRLFIIFPFQFASANIHLPTRHRGRLRVHRKASLGQRWPKFLIERLY